MSVVRLFLLGCFASAAGIACGSSPRPAAHQDFRAIQVHEARVTELLGVAADDSRSCAERSAAAAACSEEAERAQREIEDVQDTDARTRVTRLAERCRAARARNEVLCGPAA